MRDHESTDLAGAAYYAREDAEPADRPTMSDVACCRANYDGRHCNCHHHFPIVLSAGQGSPVPVGRSVHAAPCAAAVAGSAPEPATAHSLTDAALRRKEPS